MQLLLTVTLFSVMFVIFFEAHRVDSILRWEYDHHRAEWEKDGRPSGFSWRAEGTSRLSGDGARNRLLFLWMFKTPEWARQTPQCYRWFRQRRILAAAAWIAIIGLVVRLKYGSAIQ
jgi:hypothetical protein